MTIVGLEDVIEQPLREVGAGRARPRGHRPLKFGPVRGVFRSAAAVATVSLALIRQPEYISPERRHPPSVVDLDASRETSLQELDDWLGLSPSQVEKAWADTTQFLRKCGRDPNQMVEEAAANLEGASRDEPLPAVLWDDEKLSKKA